MLLSFKSNITIASVLLRNYLERLTGLPDCYKLNQRTIRELLSRFVVNHSERNSRSVIRIDDSEISDVYKVLSEIHKVCEIVLFIRENSTMENPNGGNPYLVSADCNISLWINTIKMPPSLCHMFLCECVGEDFSDGVNHIEGDRYLIVMI